MLCEICKKNEATVHYTEIINNAMSEMHLCENCAQDKGAMMKPHFPLADLLAGLADFKIPLAAEKGKSVRCPGCGITYDDFRKIGRLGCSQCYETFKDSLNALLKRVHGSNYHVGKAPGSLALKEDPLEGKGKDKEKKDLPQVFLDDLRSELKQVIEKEEFEKAAQLRDKIRKLEKDI